MENKGFNLIMIGLIVALCAGIYGIAVAPIKPLGYEPPTEESTETRFVNITEEPSEPEHIEEVERTEEAEQIGAHEEPSTEEAASEEPRNSSTLGYEDIYSFSASQEPVTDTVPVATTPVEPISAPVETPSEPVSAEPKTVTVQVEDEDRSVTLPLDTMVWIPATGHKFHSKNDCGNMNPEKARYMTISEALTLENYKACKNCY